ncbi:efflux RND transporter periplasmic adaptor subunit [Solimonas sp. K1W22B-7]|uniref:efflux RND transporter periplasmic adaptor subunit n=1 Tax=Solimonas sp. K1W22B-7 TaxID=2303331 RepID=UPI000E32D82B|nr:efflux RND transporter periplasmic adaptor subunit [Solimonas sp. K1W22B-7]AXQ30293.1 efflux RND transporter periplasmic adaptor subunit [Solimonas sp. K1W22B-7]
MTKRMIIMLLLVTVVFGGVFGMKYMGNVMMNKYVDAMPMPSATITAGAVKKMSWDNRLEAIGSFVPVNGTDVTTESGGIVTAIHFESGQKVQKGARLLTLDGANERGEYRRLQAQAELTELNRARREKLYKLEAISKSDYDAAVSEANAARAAVEAQGAKVAQKEIRAPFSGELGIRRVNVGQFINPGSPIVNLQSLDPIDIDVSLPEQYIGVVRPGFKVAVKVEAYPDLEFGGEILAVEPRIDEATRNFRLRARLPNPDSQLRAGQFGRVRLELPGMRELLVLPRTAINYDSYGTSVFVVQKKKVDPNAPKAEPMPGAPAGPTTDLEVSQRFIKVGEARGDYVVVVEGIKEGEQVATSGLLKLRNQQPVVITQEGELKNTLTPKPSEG